MVTLINARFVPVYFDLNNSSPAADPDAKKAVVAIDPRLEGGGVPTPEVFALQPNGDLLGRESNYATEDAYIAMLQKVVADSEVLTTESAVERELPKPTRAWLRYCIGDLVGATKLLAGQDDDASLLIAARIHRWNGENVQALAALEQCSMACSSDVAIERGLVELRGGAHATALAALEAVPHDHPRTSEAEYHRGVALFHLGHVDAARAVWTRVVQRHGEDRWSYRADWAVEDCKHGDGGPRMMGMGSNTLLKRHGYMGRKNPDLSQEVAGGKTGK